MNELKLLMSATQDFNIIELIGNLGFPIFVAVWLLWKSHKDTETITNSVNKLENSIIELISYIKSLKGGN